MIEIQIGTFGIAIISARYYTGAVTIQERSADLTMSKEEPMLLTQECEFISDIQECKIKLEVER